MPLSRFLVLSLLLPMLAGCVGQISDLDLDFRSNAITNTPPGAETAPRPAPDANGLITYPNYQVAVARRGDTLASLATRLGLDSDELARFNGRRAEDSLNAGEIVVMPRRVTPAVVGTDISAIARAAIDEAEATQATAQPGAEPVRHRVARGETAYSIARLYGVPVRALAEWNGLNPDLSLREGQLLIIPLIVQEATPIAADAPPGTSVAPLPPSASAPLPDPVATASLPVAQQPAAGVARMQRPVAGTIIRPFSRSNAGIDIAAAVGAAVQVAADGDVAAITRDTDQITIMVVRHSGNLRTVYANVRNIRVDEGDLVNRGQTIAEVGPGDPPFLHFEVRDGFEAVDPEEFIN